ncbi:hypothetical protein M6D81_11400 [Paenibacillus sp. J5C_2022]|uniref:hypothetical protein n=1 Tax=Paenibacillus sp. J5C2022 TaxID=2977129 RepID=UPI0021D036A4|nr:hypothetical protein [Paenibacillus sp. J5C2022]MCU6709312.1 hypothetical protein [Paenibacillus sp. J5C2022]
MRETTTWTCPNCHARNRELADEACDHPCGRCGWEPYSERRLRADIRDYLRSGGVADAFSFASLAYPAYKDVPGRDIQRIIDEVEEDAEI